MKDYRQAVVIFQEAIKEGLDTPESRFTLGLCLEKVDSSPEAIEEYFKVIYGFPEDQDYKVKAYFRIARIYERSGKGEEAEKIYRKIISLDVEEEKIARARLKALSD
jgi:tetratricopeptide (TPR) repeat protein